ncbi:MAG: Bug family tripartite tricarboxylate transporter substrate binding protein [Rubrivivax sp.]
MHANRRTLLKAGLAVAAYGAARAGAAPAGPVKLVVPYPAGGPADIVARAIAQPWSEALTRPIVIDNRAGASGSLGADAVAKSAPDGNTLLLNPSIHIILPSLRKLPYDAVGDFTHLGVTASVPLLLVVNNDVPASSVAELVAHAKREAKGLSYATSSQGSSSHLAGEQLRLMAGVNVQQVPYKGSAPAITDLIGGQVQMMFDSLPSILPFVRSGRVRALAVTTAARSGLMPAIPTMEESGYAGFQHANWYGVWGPANLPPAVSAELIRALQVATRRQDVRARLLELGADPVDGLYGDTFKEFAAREQARYARLIRETGVKMD